MQDEDLRRLTEMCLRPLHPADPLSRQPSEALSYESYAANREQEELEDQILGVLSGSLSTPLSTMRLSNGIDLDRSENDTEEKDDQFSLSDQNDQQIKSAGDEELSLATSSLSLEEPAKHLDTESEQDSDLYDLASLVNPFESPKSADGQSLVDENVLGQSSVLAASDRKSVV